MEKYKVILNQLLDLGGLATKNNFYSPEAKTVQGSLVYTRKAFTELERLKFIVPLPTITKVRNLCQERFYAITKLGARHVDRVKEYKWRGGPKSPFNIMHESMVRDIGLAFLRNYPSFSFELKYNDSYQGLRPDIVIKMTHKTSLQHYIFLVEIERKKTVDRVYNEKLQVYEKVLSQLNFKAHNLNSPVKVLVVYSNLDYNCFCRPQEYDKPDVKNELCKLQNQDNNLVKLSKGLPVNRYRFMGFPDFYQLDKAIWQTPLGQYTRLIY